MTRLAFAVAATLAAALCLLLGVVIGRDAKPLDRKRLARALDVDWSPAWHETPIEGTSGHHGEFMAGWDKAELARIVAAEYDRDAKPDHESRDQSYVESHGWFV